MMHENQELKSYKSSDETTTKMTTPVFKQIITPQAHPCKTFLSGRESLPAQSSTQDTMSSQGFAAPLALSAALAPGWLGRACTPTTDPKGWVMHQPPQRHTGNSAPNYTQSKPKFVYTQEGSGFDDCKDQPHARRSHCDLLCSLVHQDCLLSCPNNITLKLLK